MPMPHLVYVRPGFRLLAPVVESAASTVLLASIALNIEIYFLKVLGSASLYYKNPKLEGLGLKKKKQ
jgi:hypothetical protein